MGRDRVVPTEVWVGQLTDTFSCSFTEYSGFASSELVPLPQEL